MNPTTNPLPQLIPACQRVAKACGVEMPSNETCGMAPGPEHEFYIPDDLYTLMLVGWVVDEVQRTLLEDHGLALRVDYTGIGKGWDWWVSTGPFRPTAKPDHKSTRPEAITAALTAACDILDGRGEVG